MSPCSEPDILSFEFIHFIFFRYYATTICWCTQIKLENREWDRPAGFVRGWLICLRTDWDQICCEIALGYELINRFWDSYINTNCGILGYAEVVSSPLSRQLYSIFFIFLIIIHLLYENPYISLWKSLEV